MIKIVPSILSADFGRLADQIAMVEAAGADLLHIDVMDGHFVPNLTYGPLIIRKCKELSALPLDVHLMTTNAEEHLETYIESGADYISLHAEAVKHLQRALARLREAGVKAGVALNPATPISAVEWVLEVCDFILVMSVNPGYGAQKFIPSATAKIASLRETIARSGRTVDIEVDGGVGPHNAAELARAGATMLVAGNAIFKAKDPPAAVRLMRQEAAGARRTGSPEEGQ